jgi:hypothetical protein
MNQGMDLLDDSSIDSETAISDGEEDIAEISDEQKRTLLGLNNTETATLNVSKAEYESGCRPRFGEANPEEMKIPFWHEMVWAGISGYGAKVQFDDADNTDEAIH